MKFTLEELSEALKVKLTNNGKKLSMSERTFANQVERIYNRLAKRENDEELNDVVKDYVSDFEEIDGNIRHDNSSFIKSWGKEHKQDSRKEDDEKGKTELSALETLQKQVQDLLEKQKLEKSANEISQKKNSLIEKLKEAHISDEKWIKGQMELVNINTDTDIEDFSKKIVSLYNQQIANVKSSTTPKLSYMQKPNEAHEFDDIVAALKDQ